MFASNIASQWQMCQNAVALMEHTDLAVDLMLGPIDRQNALGQLPDMYDDAMCESLMLKPPMHGWAVLQIMKQHDLLKDTPRGKLEMLYGGMCKWGDWFLTYRDEDGDGLPSNWHSDETGFDASSLFREHIKLTTPDLAAYLVLLFEACGELAKLLGKAEADVWFNKSQTTLAKLIDKLWDGSRFVALDPETGEKVVSDNLIHYMPAILGDRLPKDILDKLVADLSDPSRFFTAWGLASEALTSEYYDKMAFGCGSVLPPAMLYVITGLWDTEHRAFAKRIAENYCTTLHKDNFPFFIDAKTGEGLYYGCSWSNCAYTILAKMISEG
jgi:hypothetical protein